MYREWKEDTVKSSWSSHGIHRRTKESWCAVKDFFSVASSRISISSICALCASFSNSSFDYVFFFFLLLSKSVDGFFLLLYPSHNSSSTLSAMPFGHLQPLPFWFLQFVFFVFFFLVYEKISYFFIYLLCICVKRRVSQATQKF